MRLRDFRLWVASDRPLAERFSRVCAAERVIGFEPPPGPAANCLLVDSCWLRSQHWSGVEELLGACAELDVARMLWVRDGPLENGAEGLHERFDRVFTTDVESLGRLEEAGFSAPSPLHEAVEASAGAAQPIDTAARRHEVVCIGGWRPGWLAPWRARVESILRAAAPFGLRIYGNADPSLLPPDLRAHAVPDCGLTPAEVLAESKLAIAIDPVIDSPGVAPAVVFDASVCGAASVSPHLRGVVAAGFWSLRREGMKADLVPIVEDGESAAREIERLLSDDALREQTVQRCRGLIVRNHTYAHRAATIASALGWAAIPDGHPASALR